VPHQVNSLTVTTVSIMKLQTTTQNKKHHKTLQWGNRWHQFCNYTTLETAQSKLNSQPEIKNIKKIMYSRV